MTSRLSRLAPALLVTVVLAATAPTPAAAAAPIPIVTTVAGGGSGEGLATAFPQEPRGLALHGSTLYVADTQGFVVRALDLTTGRQTVVAGAGVNGFSGDGGPARAARLYPGAVAVDAAGRLFIADTVNHRVRMVDASGIIRTVVGTGVGGYGGDGGPATSARLASPASLAFDAAGNLYIADGGNWRVRKVTPQGVITTIAGNGVRAETGDGGPATAASLEPPGAVAVDGSGNVYVNGINRVRRIAAATGIITTVVGNGTPGKGGDGGPATAAQMDGPVGLAFDAAGNLYVSDYWNVRRVDTSGIITSFIGVRSAFGGPFGGDGGPATEAHLYQPTGVVAAPGGSFYVADTNNGRVRMVNPAGTISTIAGNGYLLWGGDGGPAVEAQLANPRSVATDGDGNLYILDGYVRRVDRSGTITAFAGDPDNAGNQFGGDGGPATEAPLSGAVDVATDTAGNVYIAEQFGNRVRKVDLDGVITTVAGSGPAPTDRGGFSGDGGPATSAQLFWPSSVAADAAGNVYIADTRNNRIRKVDPDGVITTIAGNGQAASSGDGGPATSAAVSDPSRLEVDVFGNLYFLEFHTGRVRRIDPAGTITTVAAVGQGAGGLALDGAGRLFVSRSSMSNPLEPSTWSMQVVRVDAGGTLTPIAGAAPGFAGDGGPATQAQFFYPYDVAFDPEGNLYVADGLNRRVRQISDAGTPSAVGEEAVRFAGRAYLDLLGREPSAIEVAVWGALVANGMPREWLGGVLVTTTEFRLLVSVATYQTWLGRAPTAAEATAVANRLASGTTLEQVWADLAGSEESWARHGRNAGAYVDDLYRLGFGREPDAAGRAFWVDKLTHGYSRTTAALAFALNPEGSTNIVKQCYTRFLAHEADPLGLDFWVRQLQAGFRTEYVLAFFVGSNEYRARTAAGA